MLTRTALVVTVVTVVAAVVAGVAIVSSDDQANVNQNVALVNANGSNTSTQPARSTAGPANQSGAPVKPTGVPATGLPAPGVVSSFPPAQERPVGIISERQGLFSSVDLVASNAYQGPQAGRWVIVFAGITGSESASPRRSAVDVETTDVDGSTGFRELGVFIAPKNIGALTVVGVAGSLLTLRGSGGASVTFDISTLTFG